MSFPRLTAAAAGLFFVTGTGLATQARSTLALNLPNYSRSLDIPTYAKAVNAT